MEELEAKYQRLLTVHAEMKSKMGILKQAVRSGQETSAKLEAATETIRQKDQQIRDLTQQLEAQTFQTHQMTKRVESLQQTVNSKSGSSKAKRGLVEEQAREEEMMRLIQTQAELHSALAKVSEERDKLALDLKQVVAAEKEQSAAQIASITQQLTDSQVDADNQRQKVEDLTKRAGELEGSISALSKANTEAGQIQQAQQRQLNSLVATLLDYVQDKIVFDDTEHSMYNSNTSPAPCARRQQLPTLLNSLGRSAQPLCTTFATALADTFALLRQRMTTLAQQCDLDLSICHEYSTLLESSSPIQAFESATTSLCTAPGPIAVEQFLPAMGNLASYLSTISDAQGAWVSVQNQVQTSTPTLRKTNTNISSSMQALATALQDTTSSISALIAPASSTVQGQFSNMAVALDAITDTTLRQRVERVVASRHRALAYEQLVRGVTAVHKECQNICSLYSSKVLLEKRAFKLSVDACQSDASLSTALNKLTVSANKLVRLLYSNAAVLSGEFGAKHGIMFNTLSSLVDTDADKQAVSEQDAVDQLERFKDATRLKKADAVQAMHSTSNVGGTSQLGGAQAGVVAGGAGSGDPAAMIEAQQQVAQLTEDLAEAQQQREQALLEIQLLQLRLKSSRKTSTGSGNGVSSQASQGDEGECNDEGGMALIQGDVPPISDESQQREVLIRRFFHEKLEHLSQQVSFADSKAVAFFEECKALTYKSQRLSDQLQQVTASKDEMQSELQLELRTRDETIESLINQLQVKQ
eukprot:m.269550 g.269550  ORF g.269550 m.269550 type:complete len:757 (-) comp15674_c0_seq9:1781-4051(-)